MKKTLIIIILITITIWTLINISLFNQLFTHSIKSQLIDKGNIYLLSLEKELKESLNANDDLMLFSYIDFLKNQPDIIKICIQDSSGKIIAHTNSDEINNIYKIEYFSENLKETTDELQFSKILTNKNEKFLIQIFLSKNKITNSITDFCLKFSGLYIIIIIILVIIFYKINKGIKNQISLITEKKDGQQNLKEKSIDLDYFKKFIMSINKTEVLILDNTNKITYANEMSKRNFGLDIIGKNIFELQNTESILKNLITFEGEKFII
ncbi:MAG: PAS domain-containing protein [Candidatus Firestonebacteria bacterium]